MRNISNKYFVVFLFVFFHVFSAFSSDFQQFLDALSKVESSGGKYRVNKAEGAYGKYQITKNYFLDAQQENPILNKYRHSDCIYNDRLSEQVVWAYMSKYEPDALRRRDWEIISKCHNGGPRWRSKKPEIKVKLEKYWRKIRVAMAK